MAAAVGPLTEQRRLLQWVLGGTRGVPKAELPGRTLLLCGARCCGERFGAHLLEAWPEARAWLREALARHREAGIDSVLEVAVLARNTRAVLFCERLSSDLAANHGQPCG